MKGWKISRCSSLLIRTPSSTRKTGWSSGTLISERDVQPEKTFTPRETSCAGRLTDFSAAQELKALSPSEVRESGSVTEARLRHSEKASGPMERRSAGRVTETSEEQDWNVE